MSKFNIGIIREGKIPPDNRTPLTPRQCMELEELYPQLDIKIESAPFRCFSDEDYKKFGVEVVDFANDSDLLIGIKEVPVDKLVPGKTYMFFSHTHKKQSQNRKLLQAILAKRITLIDFELITDEHNARLIGFGRWAGIVGAHHALIMLGERTGRYKMKPASQCLNLQEITDQYHNLEFPPAKIVITGGGRVASGAIEVMKSAGITLVDKLDFLTKTYEKPVYTILHSHDIYYLEEGKAVDKPHFYQYPQLYKSDFKKYTRAADILINCIFWNPQQAQLFNIEDAKEEGFKTKLIADISCDIDGSVPLTIEASSINNPVFGYYPSTGLMGKPYQPDSIDIMAVPNLPNELPRDASRDFGFIVKETLIPKLILDPHDVLFERATITKEGRLTPRFAYLQDYADGE